MDAQAQPWRHVVSDSQSPGPEVSWGNVTVFNPENGQIGETSVWDRIETQTLEERPQ